jgi:transcriptional regulator with XRE-family HTH domain
MATVVRVQTAYRFRLRRSILSDLVKLNISQNDFARRCGISSGFMSQLLSGARHAGPKTRRQVMAALPTAKFEDLFEDVQAGDSDGL